MIPLRQGMLVQLRRRSYSQATIESYMLSVKDCWQRRFNPPIVPSCPALVRELIRQCSCPCGRRPDRVGAKLRVRQVDAEGATRTERARPPKNRQIEETFDQNHVGIIADCSPGE